MRILVPNWKGRSLSYDLFQEMDRLFDGANRADLPAQPYEISETESYYLLSFDMPGMKKEDIKIEVVENRLSISGERSRHSSLSQSSARQAETYHRNFSLPVHIESANVEAKYENGVLELYLPKIQAVKPRQVEIQSGKTGIFEKLLNAGKPSSEGQVTQ